VGYLYLQEQKCQHKEFKILSPFRKTCQIKLPFTMLIVKVIGIIANKLRKGSPHGLAESKDLKFEDQI